MIFFTVNKEVGQLVPQYLAAGIRLRHHLYHRELPPEKALQRAKEKTLALFDAVFGSDIDVYVETIKRLREMPVTVVHGGHEPSFGRERMIAIAKDWLSRRAS